MLATKHILMSVNATWNIRNFRQPILDALMASGANVTVLAPEDDTVAKIKESGANHIPLKMDSKGVSPIRDSALALRLYRVFRQQRPDIILSYTIKNNIYGAFAAHAAGIPLIPNVSGLGTAFLSGNCLQRVAEMLYRRAFNPLDTVFFQNQDDQALFLEQDLVTQGQAHCLPGSGISLEHFRAAPLPEGAPVFLMIARLLRDKGVIEYVEAARRVRARHPNAVFRLMGAAGADNRSAISRQEVQDWHDEGIIDYLGTSDDVRPHIARASCIVLPSYREGAPRALLEGAAMARPLIATDVPGCRSVVEDGRTGLLCAAKCAASLATICERFLSISAAERSAMGQAGRTKIAAEFDERLVVEAYLQAIDRALARKVSH